MIESLFLAAGGGGGVMEYIDLGSPFNWIILAIFIIGYTLITIEHNIHVEKTAPALITGMLSWAVLAVGFLVAHGVSEFGLVTNHLNHLLAEIAQILFFLLGAMTIVEIIDSHDGFHVITSRINPSSNRSLMWILCILTFFMSAVLDNLTTAIVMASLLKKLIKGRISRMIFAGMIIISANAGGAWSPMGDVTTTMLWIGGQISASKVVLSLIIPSFVAMLIPLLIISPQIKGEFQKPLINTEFKTTEKERYFVLALGVSLMLFVPVFKVITHLPPFTGMLFGLGVLWFVTELMHSKKSMEEKSNLSVIHALEKIDTPSILFFLGILSAVGALQATGLLAGLAKWLLDVIGNIDIIVIIIGAMSAVVDNVPLVAASQKMFSMSDYVMDSKLWQFIAYCAGVGGSMLIIGSAAGVAIMGIEKIPFFWYVKRIGWLAAIGYIAGAIVYLIMYKFIFASTGLTVVP